MQWAMVKENKWDGLSTEGNEWDGLWSERGKIVRNMIIEVDNVTRLEVRVAQDWM